MKKTALEEEIQEDVNRLKEVWGIEEPPAVDGWVLPELLQHIRKQPEDSEEKETDLGGCTGTGTWAFAGDRKGMDRSIQPNGCIAPQEVYTIA